MNPSIGKKLSSFAGMLVLLAVGAVGVVSYTFLEAHFAQILRKDTMDAATLLASRIRNELRHVAEKGRILSSAALEEFKRPDDQIRFLEENLSIDDQFIALTLYRHSKNSDKWSPVFRLSRQEGDPAHLEEDDFAQLDLKYPLDLPAVATGATEVTVGALKDGTPILRLAVPIVRKSGGDFTQILGIEVRQERVTAAFAESTAHFSFILDRTGRVLSQTDPTHFTLGEDLSHLPILAMARSTDAPSGNLDYYELPGSMLQYGSYHKVGYADLVVLAQAPRTHVIHLLRLYTRQAGILALACVLLAMAFTLVASWGIIGNRLARLGTILMRVGDGRFGVYFPETHSGDEIGDFARKLQGVCDELRDREKVHGTIVKLNRNRRAKNQLLEGKINFSGVRVDAYVLHCQVRGIEAIAMKADPEFLVKTINRFNQAVADAIEERQGIVDQVHGGTIVAYWGVPVAEREDADHALEACIEIRKVSKLLNESLRKARLPEVSLGVGMHFGPVVAGQVGTEDRLEYTVIGEALEVAGKIQTYTDQFGTDLLITSAVAERAPQWYSTEQVASGDENALEMYEVVAMLDRAKVMKELESQSAMAAPSDESDAPAASQSKKNRARGKKAKLEAVAPPPVAEAEAADGSEPLVDALADEGSPDLAASAEVAGDAETSADLETEPAITAEAGAAEPETPAADDADEKREAAA